MTEAGANVSGATVKRVATVTRVAQLYRFIALTTFNTLVFFLLLNLLAAVYSRLTGRGSPDSEAWRWVRLHRELFADLEAYTRIPRAKAIQYLDEQDVMHVQGFAFAPWTLFRNREFHGTLLNVDAKGFRRVRSPRPFSGKPTTVAVLGGSIAFGYGVPDDETIPSHLQAFLEERSPGHGVVVENYGQAYYYSSQELLLFASLLKDGKVPDWAIFVDGLNEITQLAEERDEPWFTKRVREWWNGRSRPSLRQIRSDLTWLPLFGVAADFVARARPVPNGAWQSLVRPPVDQEGRITDYVVSRYTSNRRLARALCKEYGVRCRFVWYPNPFDRYDRSLLKGAPIRGAVPGYFAGVASRLRDSRDDDFLFLGDLLEHETRNAYVDECHFSDATNERIARKISETISIE